MTQPNREDWATELSRASDDDAPLWEADRSIGMSELRELDCTVPTTGIVLAGGESRRFGSEDKMLANFDGEPLVDHVVSSVVTAIDRQPVVSVNRPSQRDAIRAALDEYDPVFVQDSDRFQGPVAGVAAALQVVSTPWVFLTGCDMPVLSAEAITWLSGYCSADVEAVVPVSNDYPEPLHAFYRRNSLQTAVESCSGSPSLQSLIDALPSRCSVSFSEAPRGIHLGRSIRNVNTKEELERLEQLHHS